MTIISIEQITCRRCNLTLPKTEFHKSHKTAKGKTNVCKKCISVETKAIYARQKTIIKSAPTEKPCLKCRMVKVIDLFDFRPTTKDGRNTICKKCVRARSLAYGKRRREASIIATEKQCAVCESTKPAKDFYIDRGYKDGLSRRCRPCNRDTINLAKRCRQFGITVDDYRSMVHLQKDVCAICKRAPLKVHPNGFSIDHCHASGIVRGLLCNHCNTGLGFFEDNPTVLQNAVAYLTNIPTLPPVQVQ